MTAEAESGAAGGPGDGLLELAAVMRRLRRDCPWDARQTHETLAPHLLEETYEALEALEDSDQDALREELGDVLLQVFFHAEIASERGDGTGYTIDDVARGIAAKLIRRHPHVFGDVSVSGADEVKQNWDAIKAAERQAKAGRPGSVLDGVPFGQPALALAAQLQRRAERAGAPTELADLAETQVQPSAAGRPGAEGQPAPDESQPAPDEGQPAPDEGQPAPDEGQPTPDEGQPAPDESQPAPDESQLGDQGKAPPEASEIGAELFALVARARAAGLDPELELRAAARAYRDRVHSWERSR
jgi:NTP pyrophosphatase (non-canonical NTP hydrolase)